MYKELLKLEEEGLIKVFTLFRSTFRDKFTEKRYEILLNFFVKREMIGGRS